MSKTTYRPVLVMLAMMLLGIAATAQSRESVPASEVTGTFRRNFGGQFKQFSNRIMIAALGGGKLRVAMDLVHPYWLKNNEPMVNLGQMDETFSITGDTAVYVSEQGECRITIKFLKPGSIRVEEDLEKSACGFGNKVTSTGSYQRVSSKKPKFEPAP